MNDLSGKPAYCPYCDALVDDSELERGNVHKVCGWGTWRMPAERIDALKGKG